MSSQRSSQGSRHRHEPLHHVGAHLPDDINSSDYPQHGDIDADLLGPEQVAGSKDRHERSTAKKSTPTSALPESSPTSSTGATASKPRRGGDHDQTRRPNPEQDAGPGYNWRAEGSEAKTSKGMEYEAMRDLSLTEYRTYSSTSTTRAERGSDQYSDDPAASRRFSTAVTQPSRQDTSQQSRSAGKKSTKGRHER